MTLIRRFVAAAMATVLCGAAAAQEAKLKVATVDMQQLFKAYHRTNEVQKQIHLDRARIQRDDNERATKIRELDAELQNLRKQLGDSTLGEMKRQEIHQAWTLKQQEGESLDRERRETQRRRMAALNEKMGVRTKELLEEIRRIVEEVAKKEGYDHVFDRSGLSRAQIPFLLYTKDAADMTAVLLKDLNKDAPAAGPEPPDGDPSSPDRE